MDWSDFEDEDFEEELTAEERVELEADLEGLIVSLGEAVASKEEHVKPVDLDQPFGRLSRMDAIQRQKMAQATQRRVKLRLKHVEQALRRIRGAEEDYGFCVHCEEPIGYRRLKARPEATVCMPCIRESEETAKHR